MMLINQDSIPRLKSGDPCLLCDPFCPICRGIGYYRVDLPTTHNDFGKAIPCPNRARKGLYGEHSGLNPEEMKWTWDRIIPVHGNNIFDGVDAVKRIVKQGFGWIYLTGGYGQGKSLILKIAIATFLRSHETAAYTRMAEILDHLRAAYDTENPSQESEDRLNWWANLPLLAIDEFDRVRQTEFGDERRFRLLDFRYEQAIRGESITIMASNSDPKHLPGYLYDRIRDGRFEIIQLEGRSVRPGLSW